jgi:hypothetical protein
MLLAWLIMAVAMSLNGIFRVKILAVRWGDVWAGVASAASGIALIQLIARQAMGFRRRGVSESGSPRFGCS